MDNSNIQAETWGVYSQKWFQTFKARRQPATQEMYTRLLNKQLSVLNDISMSSITVYHIQPVINQCWNQPATTRKLKLTINQVFRRAVKDGVIPPEKSPADDIEYPRKKTSLDSARRVLTPEELEVLHTIRQQQIPAVRNLILLLQGFGLRPQEVIPLQKNDFDFDTKRLCVHRAVWFDGGQPMIKETKTGKVRYIPIPDCIREELKEHLLTLRDDDYVVQIKKGKMVCKSWIPQNIKRIQRLMEKELGHELDPGFCAYAFRHTYATALYYHGVSKNLLSIKGAAQLMGHSEAVYISTYTHLLKDLEKEDEVVNKISVAI